MVEALPFHPGSSLLVEGKSFFLLSNGGITVQKKEIQNLSGGKMMLNGLEKRNSKCEWGQLPPLVLP